MVDVVSRVNPDEPETHWLESMARRAEGDGEELGLHLEEALASDIKHNEFLLQDYTQLMLDRGADFRLVNWAANRWRENHPFSSKTLRLRLATGPADDAEASFLRGALGVVPWVGGVELVTVAGDEVENWYVLLDFRPAKDVDIRQAIEAVSLLSLSPDQRSRFRVTCLTLDSCELTPRR